MLLSACPNYATLQEVDTVPQGHQKIGIGATFTTYEIDIDDDGVNETVSVPALNLWYRRGIASNLEVHAAAWLPLGASAGLKYQLAGKRELNGLAIALGLDAGYLQLSSEDSMMNKVTATIIDTYVPLYVGYRVSPNFALYTSPKYILRTSTGTNAGTAFSHLFGGSGGLAIGGRTTFLIEGTVMYDTDVKAPALQGGLGIAF